MKKRLLCALAAALLCLTAACQKAPDSSIGSQEPAVSVSSSVQGDAPADRPTIPEGTLEDLHYLYDFSFSQRYDDRITDQFSLTLPDGEILRLFEPYQYPGNADSRLGYPGDGLDPHEYSYYSYICNEGKLIIGTDYYVPDQREYISCLWTNLPGAGTDLGVTVGSTEQELLLAYTDNLFFMERDEAFSELSVTTFLCHYINEGDYALDPCYEFDCAYLFQPFTHETNELRDIMFYMKDGVVTAIETMEPFELRHVYGFDKEMGLQESEARRSALA